MALLGMPYFSANWTPLVSGWPVTSAVIFADGEPAHASIKAVEAEPMPTGAKPMGFCGAGAFCAAGARFCASAPGTWVAAAARVESLVKSRRFMHPPAASLDRDPG